MARGRVDTGVRNSIRTVVGYAGLALAGLIAISSAGIDLSSFALVAGGLSLGIGFGLQNVVSNFVSGLILLAERPFKAGDWIVAGDVSGTVKKISVRATEIETFQRQSVILPNSQLINSAVGNWTHRNKLGRIDIKVGVAYGTDVKRAHAVLLDIARSHPLVLKNPEPFVLFANFGPAALEFEIRVFLADVLNGNIVQNDIRFAVLDAFDARGHRDPVDAARRGEKSRKNVADRRREGRGRARRAEGAGGSRACRAEGGEGQTPRRESPIRTERRRRISQLWHERGIQLPFRLRSPIRSLQKGGSPATEAVGTTGTEMLKTLVATLRRACRGRFGAGGERRQSRQRAAHADRHRRRQQVRARARRRRNRRFLPERLLRHHAQWRHRSADRQRDGRDFRRRRPHQVDAVVTDSCRRPGDRPAFSFARSAALAVARLSAMSQTGFNLAAAPPYSPPAKSASKSWAMAEFPSKAKVVIIGLGGIVGASVAHHLIERGWDDIVGIDKSGIPTDIGSTAHASDFCYTTSHDFLSCWTTLYSIDFYEKMGHYARIGGLEVARVGDDGRMDEIKRKVASAKAFGTRARLIEPAEIKEKFPLIEEDKVQGGLWDPDAGLVIPRSQTVAGKLVDQAEKSGKLKAFANTPAKSLVIENGRIKGVVTDRGTIDGRPCGRLRRHLGPADRRNGGRGPAGHAGRPSAHLLRAV